MSIILCVWWTQVKDHKIITAAEDYTVCVWYTKKLSTLVSSTDAEVYNDIIIVL